MMTNSKPLSELSVEELSALAARFDRPGPRYTSYPTAVQFTEAFGPGDYLGCLRKAAERPEEPLSIYIHIPFCAKRCAYCGCQTIAEPPQTAAEEYLVYLEKEMSLAAEALPARRGLKVLHLGGGTPTYLSPAQIERLFQALGRRFQPVSGAEISSELDPRVTTEEHLRTLRALGANRVSLGVQDFTEDVQDAIGRHQSAEQTIRAFEAARAAGFEGINIDLVYGLPRQTVASIVQSVNQAIRLRPDRVAIYGYAHVPWMRPHQKKIDPAWLPPAVERLRLFLRAREMFLGAGYVQIGMDHFALPADDLAAAARERRLGRNFMGYTPHSSLEILGLGMSSIGHIGGAYAQSQKELSAYYRMLDAGTFPIERGYACTADDNIRRWAIHQILCNFHLDFRAFRGEAGISFEEYFREEAPEIEKALREGLIARDAEAISVTELGKCFVRNVAMIFDRHNREPSETGPRFSRTV